MENRREFIKKAGLLSLGAAFFSPYAEASKVKKFGIQLYSLRDTIAKDTKNILTQLASYGYKELESYGVDSGKFHGFAPAEFKKMVDDLGMKVVSAHASWTRQQDKDVKDGIDVFAPKWKSSVEAAAHAGLKYINVPWTEGHFRKSVDDFKACAEALNKLGEYTVSQGLKFNYHNHAFEFDAIDGVEMMDVLLKECDPKYVNFEFDLYWVVFAGKDPVTYFEKYPGRFPQWHVKDMNKNKKEENADVGSGSIDFARLFKSAKKAGTKSFFVEHETNYNPDPITSAKNSAAYLKSLTY